MNKKHSNNTTNALLETAIAVDGKKEPGFKSPARPSKLSHKDRVQQYRILLSQLNAKSKQQK